MWLLVLIFNIIITFIIIVGEVKDNDLSLEEVEQFLVSLSMMWERGMHLWPLLEIVRHVPVCVIV